MSSMTFESSPTSTASPHPVVSSMSMMLDSNKGNTCGVVASSALVMGGATSQLPHQHPLHQQPHQPQPITMMNYGLGSGMTFHPMSAAASSFQHPHQHTTPSGGGGLVYTSSGAGSMGTSVGESSSTTSSLSSSRTRLHQHFDGGGGAHYGVGNTSAPADHYKGGPGGVEEMTGVEDLEPISRDRCNTWPLRRPVVEPQTSPLVHERIPEEDSLYGSDENLTASRQNLIEQQQQQQQQQQHQPHQEQQQQHQEQFNAVSFPASNSSTIQPQSAAAADSNSHPEEENDQFDDDLSPGGGGDGECGGENTPSTSKKSTTRRNAWGNMSYADLITQAILSSPDQRLTLSQVYEWMVQNVPYFRDKGDSNSSAGWKNSIRHNLSLHNRFMRIQNEGAGKSSWWVINQDAKSGRNPRRRATMDVTTKTAVLDKKRRGARKRVEMQGVAESSAVGSQLSINAPDMFNESGAATPMDEPVALGPFERFRNRTQSNISMPGGTSSSPNYEDYDFPPPPWLNNQNVGAPMSSNVNVSEITGRTDQMSLVEPAAAGADAPPAEQQFRPMVGSMSIKEEPRGSPVHHLHQIHSQQQQQPNLPIKQEDIKPEPMMMSQPPSYQEIVMMQPNQMRMHNQMMQQPKLMPSANNGGQPAPPPPYYSNQSVYGGQPQPATAQMIGQPLNGQASSMAQQQWMPVQQPQQPQQQMIYQQSHPHPFIPSTSGAMMMSGGRMPPQMMGGGHLVGGDPSSQQQQSQELPGDLKNLSNLDPSFMDTDFDAIIRTL